MESLENNRLPDDCFIDEELLAGDPSLTFLNKPLPINLFSFKRKYYKMELKSDTFSFAAELDFENPEIKIGRNKSNKWVFPSDLHEIGREQAVIYLECDKVYFKNLGQTNETAYSLKRFPSFEIREGLRFKIGNNILTFRVNQSEPEKSKYAIYVPDDDIAEEEQREKLNFRKIEWAQGAECKEFQIRNTLFKDSENVLALHATLFSDGKSIKIQPKENKNTWVSLSGENNDILEVRDREDLLLGDQEFILTKTMLERKET